jgi:membrane protein
MKFRTRVVDAINRHSGSTAGQVFERLPRVLRLAYAVGREIAEGQLSLHAMSLVYTTLLSLVPLLAVSFSVLKAFGVHNQIAPLLLKFLEPLGAQGVEITRQVIGFVENMQVGVLGAVGLSLLFYTVVSLIQKIESAFNYTWRVAQTRPLGQRFSQYLSVLMVGPILVFSALALTATLLNNSLVNALLAVQPLGALIALLGKLMSYLLVIAAFTFVYRFIPNTRVRIRSALLGATVAGLVWQTGGWLFGSFISSFAHYTAIYAGFAIVVVFMIWIYLSWLILLLGASIAFYHQYPEYQGRPRGPDFISARDQEWLALWIMSLVGQSHYDGELRWSIDRFAKDACLPAPNLQCVLSALEAGGLLVRAADEPTRYLLARSADVITLKEILDVVREAGEHLEAARRNATRSTAINAVASAIETHLDDALRGKTLKDLVQVQEAPTRAI